MSDAFVLWNLKQQFTCFGFLLLFLLFGGGSKMCLDMNLIFQLNYY